MKIVFLVLHCKEMFLCIQWSNEAGGNDGMCPGASFYIWNIVKGVQKLVRKLSSFHVHIHFVYPHLVLVLVKKIFCNVYPVNYFLFQLHEIDIGVSDALTNSEMACDVICLLYDVTNPKTFEFCARSYLVSDSYFFTYSITVHLNVALNIYWI